MSDKTTALTKKEQQDIAAYEQKLIDQQEAKFPALYNNIRVLWDQESEDHGKLIYQKQGDVDYQLMPASFKCVILATRKQYIYYPLDDAGNLLKEEVIKTDLFEDFRDEVAVYKNGVQVEGSPFHGIAAKIKELCPEKDFRKYREYLFVEYENEIYIIIVKGASCSPWFDYRKANPNRLTFAYETEISTTKEKNGAVIYFPLKFVKTRDLTEADYQINLRKSYELGSFIGEMNNPSADYSEDNSVKELEEVFGPGIKEKANQN